MDTRKLILKDVGKPPEEAETVNTIEPIIPEQPWTGIAADTALDTDLSATLGAFNNKIRRRKREHEQKQTISEKETKVRHSILLEALMNIRRSLVDVAQTDLGDRFEFTLGIDDWHGWPRLSIELCDSLFPELEYPFLAVQAYDRNDRAVIEFFCGDPAMPERMPLNKDTDVTRVPLIFKRCVRTYLDLIADIVIKAEKSAPLQADQDAIKLSNKTMVDFENDAKGTDAPEISHDLYQEDYDDGKLLEVLPALDEIDGLPVLPSFDTNK